MHAGKYSEGLPEELLATYHVAIIDGNEPIQLRNMLDGIYKTTRMRRMETKVYGWLWNLHDDISNIENREKGWEFCALEF